jgi:hypothetical protein
MEQQKQPSKFEPIKLDFSYDLKTAKFELDSIQIDLIEEYKRIDQRFKRAFYQDKTALFIQVLKEKSRLREPVHISTMGTIRGGKSHSMMSLCFLMNYFHGRIIDSRYITANSYEFLENLKEMPMDDLKNSCFQIDEEKNVFGVGSIAKKTKLTDVQNIIAKQNISTISICPNKFPNQDAFYGLRAFGRDFTQKVNRFMLYNLQEGEKGGIRPFGMIYIPIIIKLVPEPISKLLIEAYEKKKDEWIERETRGEGDVLYQIKRKTAQHFANDPNFKLIKKKDEKIVYLAQKLGSEWTKGEVTEVFNLTNLYLQGIKMED